jgi:opacity protein-like surface antigen
MRRFLLAVLAVAFAASLAAQLKAQGAPAQGTAGQPYTVEYYYKCQWGHQQEFLDLFLKNHFPLLQKVQSTGRILSLKIETPAYHTTEDGRWDYRVTIRFKDSTAATTANPDEATFMKELWPDQATYQKEEQRRFEILVAHWDLPVTDITPAKK